MEEKLKLLVVDDEPDNLDLLYRTFHRDFQVFKAESGSEALALLEAQGEMAIIISDQRMPKMSGAEFLSRTVERFPDSIRIVLTGYTDVEDLVSAINSGKVFKYITKPWSAKKLKEVVAQAAETYRVIKQRTQALSRALRQQSLSNDIMTAVRGSLDYNSTLQTVVTVLGRAFETDLAVLYPVESLPSKQAAHGQLIYRCDTSLEQDEEGLQASWPNALDALPTHPCSLEISSDSVIVEEKPTARIVVPFLDKGQLIATICLYKQMPDAQWTKNAVSLLETVSEQVALAISHARLYQRIRRQSLQMRAELDVARQIQNNLLRQSWPRVPGIKIQTRCQPAREVGGDFFEVFMHPQGDIWLAVGDVSGKGVPAALFMASAISVLRRELAQEKSPEPDKVMRNLNHSLSDDLISNNCFITMVLIRYSSETGRLVYANAGHVYPIKWSHRILVASRQTEPATPVMPTYLDARGVPLGILPDWMAAAGELQMTAGDIVLMTSDGITEATVYPANGDSFMLNQEGLWAFLQQQPAELNLDALLSYVRLSEAEQEDDQTILSLEVTSC